MKPEMKTPSNATIITEEPPNFPMLDVGPPVWQEIHPRKGICVCLRSLNQCSWISLHDLESKRLALDLHVDGILAACNFF